MRDVFLLVAAEPSLVGCLLMRVKPQSKCACAWLVHRHSGIPRPHGNAPRPNVRGVPGVVDGAVVWRTWRGTADHGRRRRACGVVVFFLCGTDLTSDLSPVPKPSCVE